MFNPVKFAARSLLASVFVVGGLNQLKNPAALGPVVDKAKEQYGVDVEIAGKDLVSANGVGDAPGGFVEQGYARIKLKIKPGWDALPVRAVRREFGDDVLLQVDANAAYGLADTATLRALDEFDLLLIEQPLAEDDLRQHAVLATRLRTPVCLDESIVSAEAAADAIASARRA